MEHGDTARHGCGRPVARSIVGGRSIEGGSAVEILRECERLLLYAEVLWVYLRGSARASRLPTHLWIEPTNRCNLRCPMCPTGAARPSPPRGIMDLALFDRLVDEIAGSPTVVYLHLAGEPLLHPELPEMVSRCRQRGLTCGFLSNGTLLTPSLSARLVEASPDWVGFSFDGVDDASHARIRVGSRFDRTLANIEEFLVIRRRLKSRRPYVTLSVIDLPIVPSPTGQDGADALGSLRSLCERLELAGLDELQITPVHRWAGAAVDDPTLVGRPGAPSPTTRCPFPWSGLAIRWAGAFVPCCIDLDGRMALGHLTGGGLRCFWNGDAMRSFRLKMAALELSTLPLCQECHVVRDRKILGLPRRVFQELRELLRIRWIGGRRL